MSFDPTDLLRSIAAAEDRGFKAAVGACEEYAEQVLADSQEICPVSPVDAAHPLYNGHSGALRDSGTVKDAEAHAGKISVEFGYNTDYAAAVHERLDLNHKYPGAVNGRAQAKFLELPIRAATAGFGLYVADRIREAVHGG